MLMQSGAEVVCSSSVIRSLDLPALNVGARVVVNGIVHPTCYNGKMVSITLTPTLTLVLALVLFSLKSNRRHTLEV